VKRPELTVEQILVWADEHHARTGRWPDQRSGPVSGAPGERWGAIHTALYQGERGLAGGETLARLLARGRGVTDARTRPPLTAEQILDWADEHHARTGQWPGQRSGPVGAAAGENWGAIDMALNCGLRGLPGGDSLARLLARQRGAIHPKSRPCLSCGRIREWALAHRRRTGRWPGVLSGPIPEAPGENWRAVNLALYLGYRGLPGGDSLARLLASDGRRRARQPGPVGG
jgi:hypothetical protein